ncbi:MAG TPA: ABC transporter permease subunit [Rhodospirillaceae bacterium]|nr:ABC transporter permease subunit [Rhodospirillaceae bacterium]
MEGRSNGLIEKGRGGEQRRAVLYQLLLVAVVSLLAWVLVRNTLDNLHARHIATGFDFLGREASFGISEHLIDYAPTDSYFRAFLVGLLNTIAVALLGIALATPLGVVVGVARLSANRLVSGCAGFYVELVRSLPLLLQLFFWYQLITESLPGPRQAIDLFHLLFISNRGLKLPAPLGTADLTGMLLIVTLAVIASVLLAVWARRRREETGRPFPTFFAVTLLILGLPLLGYGVCGLRLSFEIPVLQGFNFSGGATVTPEFAALLMGLVIYTAAFIAEIVRAGIVAVPPGQIEAALSLGLSRFLTLRLVLLPQSLRVIVPPLTSQYLNLTKNSTLAVAIGYPDLVSVANTAINQTGQAVEGVVIIMLVYLLVSLALSAAMNRYNQHITLPGRGR